MKVQMTPRHLLELIRLGIRNGNYDAAIGVIDDALAQLPTDAEFSQPAEASLPDAPGPAEDKP